MDNTLFTATCSLETVEANVGIVAVVAGPDAGLEHPFADSTLTIGKSSAAGLTLTDPSVSRLHCELQRMPDGIHFRDLASKNGSWLEGCRLQRGVLRGGTRIRLGSTTVEVRTKRQRLQRAVWHGGQQLGSLIGASASMHRLFTLIARVAAGESSLLITGESGTGKEEVARSIHQASGRKSGPFVVVDGASLSRTLADLELFGHQRGAFTGADVERAGAFERAHGGTIFLDEVGELPLDVQPKLLRVLEDRSVQRLGDATRRPVDVRVLAATHRSLAQMVNEGTFREDLFYRLAVLELPVPPLRERGDDVQILARHFLRRFAPDRPDLLAALDNNLRAQGGYRWPGNVREWRSFVRRLVALGDGGLGAPRTSTEMPSSIRVDLPFSDAKASWIATFERHYLAQLLDEAGGNVTEASRRPGLARSRLHELLTKHGLRKT